MAQQDTGESLPKVSATDATPTALMSDHLPNAFLVNPNLISGGLPEGEQAFQELASRGVKTIISVDGAKPDVDLAAKYGLRYVHLPHGYSGISEQRQLELTKAVRELPGPIYIHCHHGKHRSPAAAASVAVGLGWLTNDQGESFLKLAGTNPNYAGLYRCVANATKQPDEIISAVESNFPPVAAVPPLAELMVHMDETFAKVKSLSERKWQAQADRPDADISHQTLLMLEHYVELGRMPEIQAKELGFRKWLNDGEQIAKDFHAVAAEVKQADEKRQDSSDPLIQRLNESFKLLSKNCLDCHRDYRDNE